MKRVPEIRLDEVDWESPKAQELFEMIRARGFKNGDIQYAIDMSETPREAFFALEALSKSDPVDWESPGVKKVLEAIRARGYADDDIKYVIENRGTPNQAFDVLKALSKANPVDWDSPEVKKVLEAVKARGWSDEDIERNIRTDAARPFYTTPEMGLNFLKKLSRTTPSWKVERSLPFVLNEPFMAICTDTSGPNFMPTEGEYLVNPLGEELRNVRISTGGSYSEDDVVVQTNENVVEIAFIPPGGFGRCGISTCDEYGEYSVYWSVDYEVPAGKKHLTFGSSRRLCDAIEVHYVPYLGRAGYVLPRKWNPQERWQPITPEPPRGKIDRWLSAVAALPENERKAAIAFDARHRGERPEHDEK